MTTLRKPSLVPAEPQLTPCEFQVCYELVNTALVHKQIAAKLGKSQKTVEVQVASAYKKLGVTSRWELIQRFNSEKEVPVKSLPARGLVNRIMERLDEIESALRVLTDSVEEARLHHGVRTIDSRSSAEKLFGRRYSVANVGLKDSLSARNAVCSELQRSAARRRTAVGQ